MSVHQSFAIECLGDVRQWKPRARRYAVEHPTTVATATGSYAAFVLNVSNNGCRIAGEVDVRPGDRLSLVVEPLGLVHAEVRWTLGQEAGLAILHREPHHSDYVFACPA